MIETREQAMRRLGLKGSPSADQIRKAYRRFALQHHPDLFSTPEERAAADEGFRRLNAAKDYLLDELRVEEDIREAEEAVPEYRKAGSWARFDAEREAAKKDIPRPARDFAHKLRHAVWELRFRIYCVLIAVVMVWFFSWLFYFRFVYQSPAPGSYVPPPSAEAG